MKIFKKHKEPNWDRSYEQLLDACLKAIQSFTVKYPSDLISDFFFDSEPNCGYVLISINTEHNSKIVSKEQYDYNVEYRKKLLTKNYENWKDNAYYQLKSHVVQQHLTSPGYFDHQHFSEIEFSDWEAYVNQDKLEREDYLDDYLESRVSYTFWRVLDKLVEMKAFSSANIAQNMHLGFSFHDQKEVTLFIINRS